MKKILYLLCLICCYSFATEVYFSDQHDVINKLVVLIDKEESKIEMAMYTFTHNTIVQALIRAKERGVNVTIMVDPFTVKIASAKLDKLARSGITIYQFNEKAVKKPTWYRLSPLCHHKFILFFSQKKVWTGSFNVTYGASVANLENAVVLDTKDVFQKFSTYFKKIVNKYTQPFSYQ